MTTERQFLIHGCVFETIKNIKIDYSLLISNFRSSAIQALAFPQFPRELGELCREAGRRVAAFWELEKKGERSLLALSGKWKMECVL